MKSIALLFALPLLLAGCATLTAEDTQAIAISTTPAGAQCHATNAQGSWNLEQTPGSVTVARSFSPLTITCNHKAYRSATQTLEPQTRNRAYGNILLGGVPAVVDAGTGAGYEYAPDSVSLTLTK